jgi:flagellar biosynthesis/type III secretory pathway M-ring protein FliF/YscJ
MKFTFRYLMYTLVLIGFIAFTTTLCSKALMSPILEKEPLQESIIYQKTHEARIKANVERFLEKMLGKKLFVVSVVTMLSDSVTDEISLEKSPQTVTKNSTITTSSNLNEKAIRYARLRPTAQTIRNEVNTTKSSEFSFDSLTAPVIDLPGFPVLGQKPLPSNTSNLSIPTQDRNQDLQPNHSLELENKKSNEELSFLVNQSLKTTAQNNQVIKSIKVSIIIDQDYSDYMGISLAELNDILVTVSGIDQDRGDAIAITFAPFMGKEFGWKYFVKKNQVYFDVLKQFYQKLKPIFIILMAAALLGGLGYICLKLWKRFEVARRQRNLDKQAKLEQEEKERLEKELEEKITEMEEKRQELIQLAQSQPDHFILLLNSWMEVDELELINK